MKNKKLKVVNYSDICYSLHEELNSCCLNKSCKNWISYKEGKNCAIIASKSGPKTLQEIGKIYGLTRMRICQLEKSIYEKIKKTIQEDF
jgi:DNA-directed RNA polymerase sigma subunit (sigma70/sigma32)